MLSDLTFCIIGFDTLIEYGGLTLVLIAVFIETGLLVGLVIPGGESLLFTAGLLAGTKVLDVNVLFLMIFISLAAFIGDLTGYTIGRKLGRDYFIKKDTFFFRKKNMERAERFYAKYGISAIILGRFLPFIRTFNPLLSGITGMEFRKFFIVTGSACVLYVNVTIFTGYFLGRYFPEIKDYMSFIIPAIILFMLFPVIRGLIKEIKRPA
ncbi:MAG: DedA family protein [Cytophagaceae bacterium]